MTREAAKALRTLARLRGVQTSFVDNGGVRRVAPASTLLAVLRAIGDQLGGTADAPEALRRARLALESEIIPPIVVDWTGVQSAVRVRPARSPLARLECALTLEDGSVRTWRQPAAESLPLPLDLPVGRHHLRVRQGRAEAEAVVLTAPPRVGTAHLIPGRARSLAAFLPLHALRTARSWGTADLTDLAALARWASSHGAPIVGTLPLLAGFLDEPLDPSPYAPISRLFFSELYLDPTAAPDLAHSREARLLLGSDELRREVQRARGADLVDYRAAAALKRRVLELLARAAVDNPQRRAEIDRFARESPEAAEFAAFRAAVDRSRTTWQAWPEPARGGDLRPGRDYDTSAAHYHLYCQLLLREQLAGLCDAMNGAGSVLYLDLPIGVHGGGYDVWRYRERFAEGIDVGAPPDALAHGGQNWGFPPLNPCASRADGHDYFARCLRAHLAHTRLLRIDHVMALHRLYWIPRGEEASRGVYVSYPHEELYAVLSIEAHRAAQSGEGGVRIVGENLGTVPESVNEALARHRVMGMFIAQFAVGDSKTPIPEPPPDVLAALNTHDTPTFAAFYTGRDIDLRRELGLIDAAAAKRERAGRAKVRAALDRFARLAAGSKAGDGARIKAAAGSSDPGGAMRAVLKRLAASPAAVVQVNLEDLWGELRPQNVPGTTDEKHPNWRRKAAHALEEFDALPGVAETIESLASLRRMPAPEVVVPPEQTDAEGSAGRTRRGGRRPKAKGRGKEESA